MKNSYGGQALIEGVMMCGKKNIAMAVRKSDGTISCQIEERHSITEKLPFLKWPFIRGTVNLVESMILGFKSLTYSANESAESEEEELSTGELVFSVVLALVLGMGLFFLLPALLAHLTKNIVTTSLMQNILEGLIRVAIFIVYIVLISRMSEIARVYQYHGAEHKTIHAYENDVVLIPENCRPFTTMHPRCGTSFLFLVMIISIFVFSIVGVENMWWRLLSRIVLLPVVAGISYEFLKFSSKHLDNPLVKALSYPGLMLQKLTTKEPDDEMLEVAIEALQQIRVIEEGITYTPKSTICSKDSIQEQKEEEIYDNLTKRTENEAQ